jgi:hypothetical protein
MMKARDHRNVILREFQRKKDLAANYPGRRSRQDPSECLRMTSPPGTRMATSPLHPCPSVFIRGYSLFAFSATSASPR